MMMIVRRMKIIMTRTRIFHHYRHRSRQTGGRWRNQWLEVEDLTGPLLYSCPCPANVWPAWLKMQMHNQEAWCIVIVTAYFLRIHVNVWGMGLQYLNQWMISLEDRENSEFNQSTPTQWLVRNKRTIHRTIQTLVGLIEHRIWGEVMKVTMKKC